MKFLVINVPWGKGAPTMPAFVAKKQYDFEAERIRSLRLLQALVAKPIDGEWPRNPLFGAVTGRDEPPARETLRPPPQTIRRVV